MKTTVLANQKGGVGKSAIACQLAYYQAHIGKRVLFIDFDHQKNSTKPLLKSGKAAVASFTATELLQGKATELPEGSFVIIPGDDALSSLERQPTEHNSFVTNLKKFLVSVDAQFDICLIDTNPNPDIRYAGALIVGNYILSPIQLNQEAIDGVGSLLNHSRYGYRKIKEKLNPGLELIGLLPNMVEPTPFQRGNLEALVKSFSSYLIKLDDNGKQFALIPKRSAIAEAQADGAFVAEIKKTAARDTWRDLKPSFDVITKRMSLEIENA